LLKQNQSWKLKRLIKQNSKIDLNAAYQSDVTSLPITLPNVTVNPPNKDQYRATVDVNQLITGLIDATAKIKEANQKRCNKPRSTYTNSDPESISCISRPFCYKRHAILMTKQEQLESKIKR
jgi:hypothetical protein